MSQYGAVFLSRFYSG